VAKGLKICYFPYSSNLQHPSDRRRFQYWAKHREINVIYDVKSNYDVLYATLNTPLGVIEKAKQSNRKVYFEIVDGYHDKDFFPRDLLRQATRLSDSFDGNFLKIFSKVTQKKCNIADKVICPSLEFAKDLITFNSSVHTILDFHEEFPVRKFPSSRNNQMKLIWEGQPYTLSGVKTIQKQLSCVREKFQEMKLTLITDLSKPLLRGKYLHIPNHLGIVKLKKVFEKNIRLVPWSINNLLEESQTASLAILPLKMNKYLVKHKPENRLLIMWRLGIPCAVSSIPSYSRVLNSAGIENALCVLPEDWISNIERLLIDPECAREQVMRGQQYISDFHNVNAVLKKWDMLFEF
jgi:hypothetical protein